MLGADKSEFMPDLVRPDIHLRRRPGSLYVGRVAFLDAKSLSKSSVIFVGPHAGRRGEKSGPMTST